MLTYATVCVAVITSARDTSGRYTVARDQLSWLSGEKQQNSDSADPAKHPVGAAAGSGPLAGGAASVKELTDVIRMPTRPQHGAHADDVPEQSSFVESNMTVESGDKGTKGTKATKGTKGTKEHKGHKSKEDPSEELTKQIAHDLHLDDDKAPDAAAETEHPKEAEAAAETKAAAEAKAPATEESATATPSVAASSPNSTKEQGAHAWLEADKQSTTKETVADASDKSEALPKDKAANAAAAGKESTAPGKEDVDAAHKLDESEFKSALKYLYKMAGRAYDDPSIEKGYFIRVIRELPSTPHSPWHLPFWLFIEIPSGILGGLLIGGGVPFTSMHGSEGGFYFGFSVVMLLYAVGIAWWLQTKTKGQTPQEAIAFLAYTGKFKHQQRADATPNKKTGMAFYTKVPQPVARSANGR